MTNDNEVWYVNGDPDQVVFPNKLCAERWARALFPNEDMGTRYARIHFKRAAYVVAVDLAKKHEPNSWDEWDVCDDLAVARRKYAECLARQPYTACLAVIIASTDHDEIPWNYN